MEQFNPYEALTQSKEGSFSDEALEDNAALLAEQEEKKKQEALLLEQKEAGLDQVTEETPQQTEEPEEEERKYSGFMYSGGYSENLWEDVGQTYSKDILPKLASAGAGMADFAIDAVNLTPVQIPRLPKFENDIAQGFREIASVVIPSFYLGSVATAKGVALNQAVGWRIGKDPLVKMFGAIGAQAGVGAAVDYTSSTSMEGHNATGALRKYMPELFWWIPDNIATLDDDHPDVKRDKSVKEGTILGSFTDLLLGAARIARGIKGNNAIRGEFLPEDDLSRANFAKDIKSKEQIKSLVKAKTGNEMLDALENAKEAVEVSAARRQDAMDELGRYNSSTDASLDQPMLGVDNELFEVTEQGIRSVDPAGVHGAAVDAARIAKNKNTVYGRMGSIISEGALKHGLEAGSITQRTFIKQIKESLAKGGKYSYRDVANNLTTSKEIAEAGDALATVLFDPRMNVQMMKAILEENKNVMEGIQVLDKAGYQGVFKAIKKYKDEYFNLDTLKAQAYLTHSLAGQASDMAEGMRLMEGTDAIERVQEQIIDRISYLVAEKGLASKLAGSNLRNMNMWQHIRNAIRRMTGKEATEMAEGIVNDTENAIANSLARARQYRDTLHNIRKSRPEFLKPLMNIYELTDGNVDSMYKMSEYVSNKLGTIEKAFIDGKPEIPSEVIKGAYGNLYNSLLSAIATPNKAMFGNAAMLIEKPIATMIGSIASRDIDQIRRAWYMYSAIGDSMAKGFSHMGMVFSKASRDPSSVPYMVRDDIATRQVDEMAALKDAAEAYKMNGNDGPMIMYDVAERLFDLQNHPVLRWGTNALSALDGFNRAVIANAEARGMAHVKMLESGAKIDAKSMRKAADDYYSQMFDKDGFIADKAVDYMTRDTTMSLDNKMSDFVQGLTAHIPALKPWLLFSRTPANMLSQAWNRSATSMFVGEYNKIVGLNGKIHSNHEITEILRSRNIPIDEFAIPRFKQLQAEIKGRVALGQTAVAGAVYLFMNDRITGTGHYDKERRNFRRDMKWQPRSIKGLDGKWYSYAEIGPLADWLSASVDVMDNFDLISSHVFEDFMRKSGFILSASMVNKTSLQGLQPLMDVLSGNPASWNRWLATTTSGFVPMAGMRAELGRLIYPELRVMDEELGQNLRNKNNILDLVDPDGALPIQRDWLDGTPINGPGNFFERIMNASFPVKIKEGPSPLRQFLIDIEYDARPTFAKSTGGITLNNKQRAQLWSKMGENENMRRELKEIMKEAEAMDFIGKLKKARREFRGNDDVIVEKFGSIYSRIDSVIRDAKEAAENDLDEIDDIRNAEMEFRENELRNQLGIIQNK